MIPALYVVLKRLPVIMDALLRCCGREQCLTMEQCLDYMHVEMDAVKRVADANRWELNRLQLDMEISSLKSRAWMRAFDMRMVHHTYPDARPIR